MPEVTYIGLAPLLAKAQEAVTNATTQSGEHLVGAQMAAAPVRTGTLRASIHIDTVESGGGSCTVTTATGGESSGYAIFVHEGTGAHVIEGHPWLAWPGADHPVHVVHHPGTHPDPFMSRPLLDNLGLYERNMRNAAASVF